jgi:hypothetical protein
MGVVCLCQGRVGLDGVPAIRMNQEVKFAVDPIGTRSGTLTYTADLCSEDLASSFVTIQFQQTSLESPPINFTGTSATITSIICNRNGQTCEIRVIGTMTVGNNTFDFNAEFRDVPGMDNVQVFVITGFFNQVGASPVDEDSIVVDNCQEP